MEKKHISITYEEMPLRELSDADSRLVNMAREATSRSYAPYSHFCVGAAILLDNGEIITGANQENAAFPSGTCAERTACFYAHAAYPGTRFLKIAIAARGTDGNFTPGAIAPSGACRQALLEYETLGGAPVEVLLAAADKVVRLPSVRSLLPFAFSEF